MSEPRVCTREITSVDRQRQALQLRRQGCEYEEIARRLGYRSKSGAYNAVKRGLDSTVREPADELRQHEFQRLERLHAVLWPRAMEGDLRATDCVLKIADRRCKLMGLDKLAEIRIVGD